MVCGGIKAGANRDIRNALTEPNPCSKSGAAPRPPPASRRAVRRTRPASRQRRTPYAAPPQSRFTVHRSRFTSLTEQCPPRGLDRPCRMPPRSTTPPAAIFEQGERHLRDFLKHARYLIQSTDMRGRLLFVNETWQRTLGYGEADLLAGLTVQELLAPEASAEGLRQLEAVLACRDPGDASVVELCLVARDGRRVVVTGEADCHIVDGVPVATRAIFRDVSVQRVEEARVRRVEAQHQAIIEVLGEGIAIIAADGIIELLNPSGERLLGVRAADVIGRGLLDLPWRMVDEDGGDMPREAHPAFVALHTRRPQAEVVLGVRRGDDNAPIWVAVNARPLMRSESAKPYAVAVSFRDVTVERAGARALREREARFRGVLETVRSIAVCLDTGGCITFVNDFTLELTGWHRDEVMGRDWFEHFVPREESIAALFHEQIARGEVPKHHENDILTRAGERRRIRFDSSILCDDAGAVIGTASIGQDVTEQVRAAQLKHELIAMASHELRTPLTAIRGAIDLLRAGGEGRGERERILVGMASRNAERLDRLMGDLLDVERIETGTERLRPSFVGVDTLFERGAERTKARLEQGSLTLAIHADPAELWVDVGRIEQVVVNLIGNAANFAPAGSTITMTAHDDGDAVRVAVRDEGRGIPADKLESIFEPFVKVDGGETKERGAGLGLFLCRAIVQQHGGRIWAESGPQGGTTVSFTVPKAVGEAGRR
jgi:PAS domain S-box-containing protein